MNSSSNVVLYEVFGPRDGVGLWIKRCILVVFGILALTVAAKVLIPMYPVPITMGTFVVLGLGAAYGLRLGLATILGYLFVGLLGFDVFANSSAELNGWNYMAGTTGGYLVGYALATVVLGYLARRGWDRSVWWMAFAMLIGNILIYLPGLLWLGTLLGWDKPILAWGLTPFLIGDALKLALAAMTLPLLWKIVGDSRL
ncbi:MAG: biotin transporter BioY [Aestuariivita sp.]|nr:biotin transporter BioY [Aestuariivita sp.]